MEWEGAERKGAKSGREGASTSLCFSMCLLLGASLTSSLLAFFSQLCRLISPSVGMRPAVCIAVSMLVFRYAVHTIKWPQHFKHS